MPFPLVPGFGPCCARLLSQTTAGALERAHPYAGETLLSPDSSMLSSPYIPCKDLAPKDNIHGKRSLRTVTKTTARQTGSTSYDRIDCAADSLRAVATAVETGTPARNEKGRRGPRRTIGTLSYACHAGASDVARG